MSMSCDNMRIRPFRMLENVYFVGGREVSVHVIDTGAGLMMIDSGYPHMRERIREGMAALALDIRDLRVILHSHGHYDHIGSTVAFKAESGAKTCISRIDNEITNGHRDLSWASELGYERLEPFDCDVLLEDGDVVTLGNTRVRCELAPGHTEGTFALFFDTIDHGRSLTCAMHGGVGTNSLERAFLDRYGLPCSLRDEFRAGLHRLKTRHVDVVLGNHPDQNNTEGKLARLLAGDTDAFIDPTEWPRFLDACEARLDRMLENEK